mmetsp:Transcript_41475/g.86996  ORF Transcript_41475/g.86996 Transcript_41475/m.86996 type:complete len:366 (-) Transcript_41475:144-1241(-)
MKDSVVPSSVSFSVNNQATDDYSRLTWSHDDNNDNGTIEGMCARLIATKLAMSPNDYNNNSNNTLDKDPFSQTYKPELSTLLHLLTTTTTTTDDTHNDASFPSLEEEDHQELIRLKLQLALHKQMLDSMSAKWNASRIENEALKAENEYLTEELVLARDALDVIVEHHGHKHTYPESQVQVQKQKHVEIQQQQQKPVKHRRFSLFGKTTVAVAPNNEDANTNGCDEASISSSSSSSSSLQRSDVKLSNDNARLRVGTDAARGSFQSHIQLSHVSISSRDDDIIADDSINNNNNKELHPVMMIHQKNKLLQSSMFSDHTSKTSLESDNVTEQMRDDKMNANFHTQTFVKQFDTDSPVLDNLLPQDT